MLNIARQIIKPYHAEPQRQLSTHENSKFGSLLTPIQESMIIISIAATEESHSLWHSLVSFGPTSKALHVYIWNSGKHMSRLMTYKTPQGEPTITIHILDR